MHGVTGFIGHCNDLEGFVWFWNMVAKLCRLLQGLDFDESS